MRADDLARSDWTVWTCDASVVVTDPGSIADATAIVRRTLAEVDRACSRFRADSELSELGPALAEGAEVSPMLARLVEGALAAAELTGGAVDPTLGRELVDLGYVAELSPAARSSARGLPVEIALTRRRSRWRDVALEGARLTVPAGVTLDLGATAKAIAVDLAASEVVAGLGCGVLVSVGGDIATAGPAPEGGWQVLVRDLEHDQAQQVGLAAGWAMATSSTQKRRWASGGYARHHILDPESGMPAPPVWRTVTVAAESCLRANALTTASVVRGRDALAWLRGLGVAARLVDERGRVLEVGGWPAPEAAEEPEDAARGGAMAR